LDGNRVPFYSGHKSTYKEGVEMNAIFTSTITAGARAAVPSHAHTTSKTAAKRWFYANFYAVDEATGALIG
jgi:hypothetical protein